MRRGAVGTWRESGGREALADTIDRHVVAVIPGQAPELADELDVFKGSRLIEAGPQRIDHRIDDGVEAGPLVLCQRSSAGLG